MRILVSACLLGAHCRYDGTGRAHPGVLALREVHTLIPVCPEQAGGLPTPRPPAERCGDRVLTQDGTDVTEAYRRGADEAVRLCRICGCEAAVLKARSPACGVGAVYDGTFTGVLIPGDGVAAGRLRAAGIPVFGEDEATRLGTGDGRFRGLRSATRGGDL